MDSVIVFFGASSQEQVEEVSKDLGGDGTPLSLGSVHVYLHRYAQAERAAELDAIELELIELALGAPVKSALQVACRHGESARLALKFVAGLMQRLSPAVLDDDFGGLWTAEQVQAQDELSPPEGIFHLRSAKD